MMKLDLQGSERLARVEPESARQRFQASDISERTVASEARATKKN